MHANASTSARFRLDRLIGFCSQAPVPNGRPETQASASQRALPRHRSGTPARGTAPTTPFQVPLFSRVHTFLERRPRPWRTTSTSMAPSLTSPTSRSSLSSALMIAIWSLVRPPASAPFDRPSRPPNRNERIVTPSQRPSPPASACRRPPCCSPAGCGSQRKRAGSGQRARVRADSSARQAGRRRWPPGYSWEPFQQQLPCSRARCTRAEAHAQCAFPTAGCRCYPWRARPGLPSRVAVHRERAPQATLNKPS